MATDRAGNRYVAHGDCGCAPCGGGPSQLEVAANPALRKLAGIGLVGGMGDLFPKVVYPSDVEKLKNRIDPEMLATNAGVESCKDLSDGERSAWKAFYGAWRVVYSTPVPFLFGASNEWDNATAFEQQLVGWQEELRKKCSIPGPVVKAAEPLDLSSLKWLAAAVIVVGVAYTVKTVL